MEDKEEADSGQRTADSREADRGQGTGDSQEPDRGKAGSGQRTADSKISAQDAFLPTAYSPLVVDHFYRPRNTGTLPAGPGIIQTSAGSRAHGAEIRLVWRFLDGRVSEARFRAFGCPHFLAAASLLTERLRGLKNSDLATWSGSDLARDLAFPVEKRGRLLILEDAVRAAAQCLIP